MVIYALIYIFGSLITIYDFSNGQVLNRPIRSIECDALDKTDGIIDSLKNVTLDAWPWECLNSRYNSSALRHLISNSSSLQTAASEGYIGFVQYYVENMRTHLGKAYDEGDTLLHLAVENGRLNVVKYILTKISHSDLMTKKTIHRTPLMGASYYGQLQILEYLLDEIKADTNYDEEDKGRLLRMAALGGNLTVLQYLVDTKNYTVYEEDSDLLIASAKGGNLDLIKYLIYTKNLKGTGTETGGTGDTALHKAAGSGNLEVVKFFTDTLHYSVDVPNRKNATPAHSAAAGGSLLVIRFLIDERNASLNAKDCYGQSLLHTAASYGQLDLVKYLVDEKKMEIEMKDNSLRTPICRAVRENQLDVVKYLAVEKRASLNVKGKNGFNLLHQAVYSDSVELLKYLIDDLKMMGRIDELDESLHRSPALHAASWGQLPTLRFLIDDRHANVSIVDSEGKNLLHAAAERGTLEIVKYLVEERNFDVYAKTRSGQTAYDIALANYDLVSEDLVLKYLRKQMKPESLPKN